MTLDYAILTGVWISASLLLFTIPKKKYRLALLAFLFKQLLTGLLGLIAVEANWVSYPVRELADVNRASFAFEFWAYPIVCAVFNVHYPENRNRWIHAGYFLLFTSTLTVLEVLIEKHTDLVRYIQWNWFWSWGSLFLTFLATRVFCVLFFGTMGQKNAAS